MIVVNAINDTEQLRWWRQRRQLKWQGRLRNFPLSSFTNNMIRTFYAYRPWPSMTVTASASLSRRDHDFLFTDESETADGNVSQSYCQTPRRPTHLHCPTFFFFFYTAIRRFLFCRFFTAVFLRAIEREIDEKTCSVGCSSPADFARNSVQNARYSWHHKSSFSRPCGSVSVVMFQGPVWVLLIANLRVATGSSIRLYYATGHSHIRGCVSLGQFGGISLPLFSRHKHTFFTPNCARVQTSSSALTGVSVSWHRFGEIINPTNSFDIKRPPQSTWSLAIRNKFLATTVHTFWLTGLAYVMMNS